MMHNGWAIEALHRYCSIGACELNCYSLLQQVFFPLVGLLYRGMWKNGKHLKLTKSIGPNGRSPDGQSGPLNLRHIPIMRREVGKNSKWHSWPRGLLGKFVTFRNLQSVFALNYSNFWLLTINIYIYIYLSTLEIFKRRKVLTGSFSFRM